MCSCCVVKRLPPGLCPCWCHRPAVIGGGKQYLLSIVLELAELRAAHPKGVVAGQVVHDSGELEA